MDNLPPELLSLIADSIQQDPLLSEGQQTLSALARVNKTLYSICNPQIYRHPVIVSPRKTAHWGNLCGRNVNPWTVCYGRKSDEEVVLPESLTFVAGPKPKDDTAVSVNKRANKPLDDCFVFHLEFSSFFRHLTSFTSAKTSLDADFVARLFGPLGLRRATIKELYLDGLRGCRLAPFLLEAFDRILHFPNFYDYDDLLDDFPENPLRTGARVTLDKWLTYKDVEEDEQTLDEYFDELNEIVQALAPTHWKVFLHYELMTQDPDAVLADIVPNPIHLGHPFKSLENLTIEIRFAFELYLIFHSYLFPRLHRLKLIGTFGTSSDAKYDIKLFRHSITKRNGVLFLPSVEDDLRLAFPNVFDCWEPLTEDEKRKEPRIDYHGPELVELDLSKCLLVIDEEEW
ncbi:uncharacterized protein JCM6883_001946 [Sporobolomyces salmoneus]|uniref:uncharacterized protein n=1 Tax=Sporobolomyces salmoneus TaxID=183962 RepID=UPI00317F083A